MKSIRRATRKQTSIRLSHQRLLQERLKRLPAVEVFCGTKYTGLRGPYWLLGQQHRRGHHMVTTVLDAVLAYRRALALILRESSM